MPAKSKKQQKFMGMVHGYQKGDTTKASPMVKKAAGRIKKGDAKDFASTKHKGLPVKITKEQTMTRIPATMSRKVRSATDSVESHDVDNFNRGRGGRGQLDAQENPQQGADPIALISKYSELGEVLKRSKSFSEVAEQIGQIAEMAEASIMEDGGDWFDQHTISRNMKELKKYAGDFSKLSEEMDTLHQRTSALYDDMGNVLSRYFEIAGDTRDGPSSNVDSDDVVQGPAVEFDPRNKVTTEDATSDAYQARRTLRTPKAFTRVANNMTRDQAIQILKKNGAKSVKESYNKMVSRVKSLSERRSFLQESTDPMQKEKLLRNIVDRKQHTKIDGQLVDLYSASAIVTVMDALSDQNKEKFLQLPIVQMAKVAYKLVK